MVERRTGYKIFTTTKKSGLVSVPESGLG